jgi:hypothetical protein
MIILTRRMALATIAQLAAAASLAACGMSSEEEALAPDDGGTEVETLASVAYDIMPYDNVRPELYVRAAQAMLAGDRALAEDGLARLKAATGGKRWKDLDEAEQISALASVQGSDVFTYMRSTTINTLFVDPDVWGMVGYGGSAVEHGGYINRGFDEIDWLPAGGE